MKYYQMRGGSPFFNLKKWQRNFRFMNKYHLRTMKIVFGLGLGSPPCTILGSGPVEFRGKGLRLKTNDIT
jgi:hypothetical protein